LRPADAALLDPSRLAGVATDEGGTDGHTAVMLRALGVPAVLGAAGLTHAARPGDIVVVDGIAGTVTLNPSPDDRGGRAPRRRRLRAGTAALRAAAPAAGGNHRRREGRVAGQFRVAGRTAADRAIGRAGIGLLRTEFLFMNRETVPDEAAQIETYRGSSRRWTGIR
jgi:phosphoenolpyruvate-protein kinase (PTS system EI component)